MAPTFRTGNRARRETRRDKFTSRLVETPRYERGHKHLQNATCDTCERAMSRSIDEIAGNGCIYTACGRATEGEGRLKGRGKGWKKASDGRVLACIRAKILDVASWHFGHRSRLKIDNAAIERPPCNCVTS